MGEHAECPRCERTQLEDELCEGCGLCTRCCECSFELEPLDELPDFDDEFDDD